MNSPCRGESSLEEEPVPAKLNATRVTVGIHSLQPLDSSRVPYLSCHDYLPRHPCGCRPTPSHIHSSHLLHLASFTITSSSVERGSGHHGG